MKLISFLKLGRLLQKWNDNPRPRPVGRLDFRALKTAVFQAVFWGRRSWPHDILHFPFQFIRLALPFICHLAVYDGLELLLTGIFAHRFIFAIIFRFAHLSFAESFFILQWAGVALPMFDSLISQCILRWAGVALLIFHFAIGWNLRPSFYPRIARNHFSRGWCSNQPLSAAKTAVAHEQVPLPPLTNGLPRLLFVSPSQSPFAFLPSSSHPA